MGDGWMGVWMKGWISIFSSCCSQPVLASFTYFPAVSDFICSDTPAPLNGDMSCRLVEFIYTCHAVCSTGYVENPALAATAHVCRTTGWQPPFPSSYASQSCLSE